MHIPPGSNATITADKLVEGIIATAIKEMPTPTQNNNKSKGLKILNIKVPFLALAGIKYPFISISHSLI